MAKKVDWYYHRTGWTSSAKAQGYLAKNNVAVTETVSAKEKLGAEEALAMSRQANTVIVAKGKKVTTFNMKKNPPDDEILLKHMLGTTGNLRAPTIRKGKSLLVGFNEDAYAKTIGS